ncbi:hypothetical protein [Salinivibrio socompensis]|uniref:hypothetical protein n=1 Tax=Salinivibrio socompensis TaxID=1510206 RepID=UPI0013E2886F|nr:hypothetical protein [Salinivibrio socompensis]
MTQNSEHYPLPSRSAPILTTNVGGAQDTSMHEAYIVVALFRPTPDLYIGGHI